MSAIRGVLALAILLSLPAQAQEPIKIGLVTALSGQSARAGEAITRGLTVAIDELNTKGGVLKGRKFELVRRDDEATPAKGVTAARELLFKEKVAVLFGGLDTPELERRFAAQRQLGADPVLLRYLRDAARRTGLAEAFFTERHGLVVLATDRTSDFVQSDENWWRAAMREGAHEGPPEFDSSAAVVSIEHSVALRAAGGRPVGVLKAVTALDDLASLLAVTDLGDGAYLQVVDSAGRLLVTADPTRLLQAVAGAEQVPRGDAATTLTLDGPGGAELVASVPAGRWWVLFRQPASRAYAAAGTATRCRTRRRSPASPRAPRQRWCRGRRTPAFRRRS